MLVLHKRLCKLKTMNDDLTDWETIGESEEVTTFEPHYSPDDVQSLVLTGLDRSPQEERARQIIAMMERSNERLDHLLVVLNRMR